MIDGEMKDLSAPRKPQSRRRCPVAAALAGISRFLGLALIVICRAAEDDSNDSDSSRESADNQLYDDALYDGEAADGDGRWYADDPYMPTDDAILQEMNAEVDAEMEAAINSMNGSEELSEVHFLLMRVLAGSVSILGLASAVFCTSVLLYFLRVQSLMSRYSREGVVVDAKILACDPDFDEALKDAKEVDPPEKIRHADSYSMMTDDASYMASRSGELSGSDGSGDDVETAAHRSEVGYDKVHRHGAAASGISFAGVSTQLSTATKAKQQITIANTIPDKRPKFLDESFRVIVEYDDITYHDIINQDSSEVVRKRLSVRGEDIEEVKNNSCSYRSVKLHVLRNQPRSGYPCGEVNRALRWQTKLSFNLHIMVGVAVVIGAGVVAKHLLPPSWFVAYVALLFVQIPALNCVLQNSFSQIISKEYLESGMRARKSDKTRDTEGMVLALRNGTSFGF